MIILLGKFEDLQDVSHEADVESLLNLFPLLTLLTSICRLLYNELCFANTSLKKCWVSGTGS